MKNKEKKDTEQYCVLLDTLTLEDAQLLYDKSNVYFVLNDGHVVEAWLDYEERGV